MDPTRWRRIEQLYHAALARETSERAAFLRNACGDDERLRREVESLLAQEQSAEGFLGTPALEMAGRKGFGIGAWGSGLDLIDRQIGDYQMLSRLGAGGMGEVYRARDLKLGRDVTDPSLR